MTNAESRTALAALWQPIETAPKDGTEIIVFGSDGPGSLRYAIVFQNPYGGGWYDGDVTWDYDDFTHWMPLPEPPTREEI